jgi:hypothetical protein
MKALFPIWLNTTALLIIQCCALHAQSIHREMSLSEFKSKEAGAQCQSIASGVMDCTWSSVRPQLSLSAFFVDSHLALYMVKPVDEDSDCFESERPICNSAKELLAALSNGLGVPVVVPAKLDKSLHALRWNTPMTVIEFQSHECGDSTHAGTSVGPNDYIVSMLEEALGSLPYCGMQDSLSYQDASMMYIDKKLGRLLTKRLQSPH